jgi:hypothetical protein
LRKNYQGRRKFSFKGFYVAEPGHNPQDAGDDSGKYGLGLTNFLAMLREFPELRGRTGSRWVEIDNSGEAEVISKRGRHGLN